MFVPLFSVNSLTIENAEKTENYRLEEDVEDDLVVMGEGNITIDGDINGDLFVFGSMIKINGNVEGSVYVTGGDIELNNIVGKSLYVAGGTVNVNGQIIRDVMVAGGTINLRGEIGEDVNIAGGEVVIESVVGDDVRVAAGMVKILNTVGGDVLAGAQTVTIDGDVAGSIHSSADTSLDSGVIQGDVVIYGDEGSLNYSNGVEIQGEEIVKRPIGSKYVADEYYSPFGEFVKAGFWFKAFFAFVHIAGFVMVGYLLFKFAPVRIDATLSRMSDLEEIIKSGFVGFLAFPVAGFIALLLAMSVFGWPLLKVMVLLGLLASSLVTPIAGIWIGRNVLPLIGSKRRYVVALTVGVTIIQFISLAPIVGWIFGKALLFIVVGALLRMQWSKYQMAQNLHVKMKK
jgi:hypothetical protein